jgi:hypothetical protein
METTNQTIEFTRVNNDINGNPRYVCHFLELVTPFEQRLNDELGNVSNASYSTKLDILYKIAINKARKIGGKKFHNKQYGGGIVFQSYSLPELEKAILNVKNN